MKKIIVILGTLLFINMLVMSLSKAFAYVNDNNFMISISNGLIIK